jgi:hypothetical protein
MTSLKNGEAGAKAQKESIPNRLFMECTSIFLKK